MPHNGETGARGVSQLQKRWMMVILAVSIVCLTFSLGVRQSVLSVDAPTQLPQQKLIALTFDDGPRRSTTTRLLDGLAERGVKATFFPHRPPDC